MACATTWKRALASRAKLTSGQEQEQTVVLQLWIFLFGGGIYRACECTGCFDGSGDLCFRIEASTVG